MSPESLREMLEKSAVSPYEETLAFELLYAEEGASLKKITEKTVLAGKLPSQVAKEQYGLLMPDIFDEIEQVVDSKIGRLSVAVNNTPTWPEKLSDSPVLLLREHRTDGVQERLYRRIAQSV